MKHEVYEILRHAQLAERNMNSEGWAKMSVTERTANIEALNEKIALENHMIPAEIVIQNLDAHLYGQQEDNAISLNEDLINDSSQLEEALKTLGHENSHLQEFQSKFFSEMRDGLNQEELEARLATPVPDPNQDWEGYSSHPSEQAARNAGVLLVETVSHDQVQFSGLDAQLNDGRNQILTTYDYVWDGEQVIYDTSVDVESSLETAGEFGAGNISDSICGDMDADLDEIGVVNESGDCDISLDDDF